jgi:translocation and assembly module TamB
MPALSLKNFVIYAVRILLGLLLIAGLLAWLLGTEPALQWCVQQAVRLSNGRLTLHAVHGSLYGPLRIEALSFQSDEKRYEVKEVNLDWAPGALLKQHIQLTRLSVQQLSIIESRPATESAKLPATLHLPLTFSAPAIMLDRVVIRRADAEYVLRDIDLGVDKSADSYQLHLRNLASEWGNGTAEMALGDTRPYTVTAHATLQQKDSAYRAEADASGSLEELLLNATLKTPSGQAALKATLNPFEKMPLADAHITADGINPARHRKDLPEADLSGAIDVARQGADGLQGSIMLQNNAPGTWDQSRLPLREMTLQFSGNMDQLDLHAIRLNLDNAGSFNGEGQVRNKQLQLKLSTTNFNPRGVHRKMRRMNVAGNLRMQADTNSQALLADLRYQKFRLHLAARHKDAVIELSKATVQAVSGSGSVSLHGQLSLAGRKQFQLAGKLQKINPADFGNYPVAGINASFSAAGQLAPQPQATLKFAVTDSHFLQQPLTGEGKLNVSATRIWNSDVMLQLAHNQLQLKGGLGNPGDRLDLRIAADNLAMLDPDLSGQVRATASLSGRLTAPAAHFDAQLDDLSWRKNYRIASLHASGQMDQGLDGPLALDAELQGLATPQLYLDSAGLNARGTVLEHTLQLKAKNPDLDIESRFAGGWRDESGWSGKVMKLLNRGRHAFALRAPAQLEIGRQHFVLNNAGVDFKDGSVALHELGYEAGQLVSSGEFNGLSLAYLQGFAKQTSGLKTDLTLGGEWQFAVGEKINGHVGLWRERGDIAIPTVPQTSLGLDRLTLKVEAVNNQLQGQFEAAGTQLGRLKSDAQVLLSRRNGAWGIAGDAPVSANADLAIESLAWIAPLLDSSGSLAFDGAIKAGLHAGGSFAQPELAGAIEGNRFSVALRNQGVRFTDGSFQAKLQDQVLSLDNFTLRGGDGSLSGQGQLSLEGDTPVMKLAMKADKLEVLSRPDRLLILSGSGDVSATGKKLQVAARLKADRGVFELSKGDEPTASDDVSVLNQPQAAANKNLPYALSFNLDLDLGEHFFVKGKGLDAQLGGALNLTSVDGAFPSSSGNIRVVKGAYSAYGQRLQIERGILSFQGPLDNPGLDIIAMRKNQAVEAGVAVSGTAQSPRVRLVSNPGVPDSEKLSWLVLGHGLEDASGQDYNALHAAAGLLLSAGESVTLQQKIAHATGFEDVSLKGSGELEGTMLALGKRLSSRAYLSYEHGLTGASSLVKINYTLTKRVSVQAQAGTAPAMDLFYTFRFE